jgi:xanthine/uracil permease
LRNCEICARRLDLSFGWDNPISPRIFLEWLSGPKDLIYALDEKPSPLQLLALGFQRVAVICPYLVMVALVASAAKLPHTEARNAMAWAMIAVGFLTVPQSVRIGRVGSGYLCPPVVSGVVIIAVGIELGKIGLGVLLDEFAVSEVRTELMAITASWRRPCFSMGR